MKSLFLKKSSILFVSIIFVGCASGVRSAQKTAPSNSRKPSSMEPKEMCEHLTGMEIHSHRGAWDRPENMMTAFLRAVDQGADFVEMDLQISRDDKIIVAHDAFMKKECRDAQGNASPNQIFYRDLTLAQIKTYNCGSLVPRGVPVPGERISSLAEVLAGLKDKKTARGVPLKLNIEIKYNPTQPQFYPNRDFYVFRILKTIEDSGINPAQVMIQSFDVETLRVVRSKRPDLRLSPLLSDAGDGVQIAQELRAELVTPHFSQVNPEMLERFHKPTKVHPHGIKVVPWTVNDPENASQLISWGVDGFITDNPEWYDFAKSFCEARK